MAEEKVIEETNTLSRRDVLKTAAGAGLALLLAGRVEAAADQWVAVGKTEMFVKNQPQRVTVPGGGVLYVTRTDAQTLRAVSAKCTHHGCELRWTAAAAQLQCPCHGAAFASTGKNIHGTQRKPGEALPALASLPVRQNAGQVEVNLGTVPPVDVEPRSG
jgi:nitrite reductase/ring-hydroxylating ferredoxin subunit